MCLSRRWSSSASCTCRCANVGGDARGSRRASRAAWSRGVTAGQTWSYAASACAENVYSNCETWDSGRQQRCIKVVLTIAPPALRAMGGARGGRLTGLAGPRRAATRTQLWKYLRVTAHPARQTRAPWTYRRGTTSRRGAQARHLAHGAATQSPPALSHADLGSGWSSDFVLFSFSTVNPPKTHVYAPPN